MTLELAGKRRSQSELIHELVKALGALAAGGVGLSTLPTFWCVYCGKDNSHFEYEPDEAEERHEEDCPILSARALIEEAKLEAS